MNYLIMTPMIFLSILGLEACKNRQSASSGGSNGSALSTIELSVPKATVEVFGQTAKLALLTSTHLIIQPAGECKDGTKVDEKTTYGQAQLSGAIQNVKNHCDYFLTLSLGNNLAPGATPVPAVSAFHLGNLSEAEKKTADALQDMAKVQLTSLYTNFRPYLIKSVDLKKAGTERLPIEVVLNLTGYGQSNGFTQNVNISGNATQPTTDLTAANFDLINDTLYELKLDGGSIANDNLAKGAIKSDLEWERFSKVPVESIDWAQRMVVGVSENAPSAEYSIAIVKISKNETKMVVEVERKAGCPGQAAATVITPMSSFAIVDLFAGAVEINVKDVQSECL